MTWQERMRRGRRFWLQLPALASALFFLSVFCLFASIGFMANTGGLRAALPSALFSGGLAVLYAFVGTRGHIKSLIGLSLLAFVAWPLAQEHWWPGSVRLVGLGAAPTAAIVAVTAGYLLTLFFIGTEGRRYYRLHTEVELAGEIHKALAPAVALEAGGFEFAGLSQPSGLMGGDLLDVVAGPEGWLAYVADVSGHGVGAGVLMGVVKSAARTWLAAHRGGRDGLLADLNRTLTDLLPPEAFVTFAAVASGGGAGEGGKGGALPFATAGHPPLLHFHAATGTVTRLGQENFPLGLFAGAEFTSATVVAEPGDVLALYTDGLEEIFDGRGREFGLEGLSTAFAGAARLPLAEAVAQVLAAARSFGGQSDDQTLLLARRLG